MAGANQATAAYPTHVLYISFLAALASTPLVAISCLEPPLGRPAQAQSFKAADVAAAFAELRDGPKTSGASTAVSTPGGGVGVTRVNEVAGVIVEEEDDDEGGGLFVIGDDASEASEASEVWLSYDIPSELQT